MIQDQRTTTQEVLVRYEILKESLEKISHDTYWTIPRIKNTLRGHDIRIRGAQEQMTLGHKKSKEPETYQEYIKRQESIMNKKSKDCKHSKSIKAMMVCCGDCRIRISEKDFNDDEIIINGRRFVAENHVV